MSRAPEVAKHVFRSSFGSWSLGRVRGRAEIPTDVLRINGAGYCPRAFR